MKRLTAVGVAMIAVASILMAQVPAQTILRTPAGDRPLTVLQQGGQTYVAADEVVTALGGTTITDNQGFRVTVAGKEAAFGPDSRFAVVRDDLIEMPVPPLSIDGRPFVPWQFFSGYLRITSEMDAAWDPA
ncbi:MAG: stalk domain-containing protein, partial [Thermoanaerobaculia bacterium]